MWFITRQTKRSPSHVETRVRFQTTFVVSIKILIMWIGVFLNNNNNNAHIFGDINCSVFSPHLQTDGLQQENVPQFGCLWATWLTFKWRKPLLLERENPTDCRRASNKGNRGCSGGLWKGTQCRYWRRSGLLSPTSTAKMNKLGPVRSLSNFLNRCPHCAVTECDMISRSKMTEWVLTADEHSLLSFFFLPTPLEFMTTDSLIWLEWRRDGNEPVFVRVSHEWRMFYESKRSLSLFPGAA